MFEGVAPEQFHPFILATTTTNPSTTTTTLHPPPPPPPPSSSLSPSPHLPLHLSFASPHPSSPSPSPAAAAAAVFPIGFDPYQLPHPAPPPNFFHPLNHTANSTRSNVKNHHEDRELMPSFVIPHHHHHNQKQQQQQKIITEHPQAWSNEEVLALLRIRSTMELNWFPPEFTWEHVSRKLSEVGFKRSPEKCREKFEEETRFLNSIHGTHNHSYFPNHHDENGCINQQQQNKYAHDNAEVEPESKPGIAPAAGNQEENEHQDRPTVESNEDDTEEEGGGDYAAPSAASNGNQKRKRRQEEEEEEEEKFEMFKGLCQEMVDKMMAQQEEMQNKLIEDMVRRDQEKLAREEAWKQREMDRINHELQLRADQQALAGDRQASIIKFLENFTTTTAALTNAVTNSAPPPPPLEMIDYQIQIAAAAGDKDGNSNRNSTSSSSSAANPNNNSSADELSQLEPGAVTGVGSKSIPPNSSRNPRKSGESEENRGRSSVKEEVGKRWPRDEVLALINLRCGIHNQNNTEGEGTPTAAAGSNSKAPLWERISRGMAELGYRRSAKRCKEKWENINKYFRKTKDLNKKRSADSRTCPYFHQLSTLYGAAAAAVPKPSASEEEEEQVVEGTKAGTDSENNINASIAASDGTSAAAEIVAPVAAAAASFGYEF